MATSFSSSLCFYEIEARNGPGETQNRPKWPFNRPQPPFFSPEERFRRTNQPKEAAMPDNPSNPNPPNNPPHVPTLADKQIDLSAFQLMDFDSEELRDLPRPHADFAAVARQVLALYPDFEAALKLTDAEFDPAKVAAQLDLADQLQPYSEWLERRAEQVRETRLVQLAEAYRAVLRLYQRAQAAAEFDPQVGYAFAFLGDHFGAGKKKGKKE